MPDWDELPLLSNSAAPHDEGGNILGAMPIDNAAVNVDPRIAEFILYGVFNGSFARGPLLGPNTNIGDENPLPDWTGPTQVSGGAITCQWVADASSPSGYNLRFTIAPGAAGDEAYIEQIVPILGSRAQRIAQFLRLDALRVVVSGGAPLATVECRYLTASSATTGAASSATTALSVDATLYSAAVIGATAAPPADAAFLRLRVGVRRNTMAASDTATIDFTDVRLDRNAGSTWVPDGNVTYGAGVVGQTNGALFVKPAFYSHTSPQLLLQAGTVAPSIQIDGTTGVNSYTAVSAYHRFSGGPVNIDEQAAPSTPASGQYSIYAKTDGKLYGKNDGGTEIEFGSGGSLTDHTHAATGSGATGGGATLNPVTLSVSGTTTMAGAIIQSGVIAPTINANQNDYGPAGFATSSIMAIIVSGATRTITGFDSTGWTEGQTLIIQVRTNDLVLSHNSASSTSGNRLGCPNAAALTVRQGGGVMLVYAPSISSAAPWRVTSP